MDLELEQLKKECINTQINCIDLFCGLYSGLLTIDNQYTVLDIQLNIMSDEFEILVTNDLGEKDWYIGLCFEPEQN